MALTVPCRDYPVIHLYLSFLFKTQTDFFLLPIRNLISTFIHNKEELLISCPETSPSDHKINSGFLEWNFRLTFKPFLPSSSNVFISWQVVLISQCLSSLLFLFYFSCHQTGSGFHCLLGGLLLWLFPWFLCPSPFPPIPLQHTVVREIYVLSLSLPCLKVFHLYSLSTK